MTFQTNANAAQHQAITTTDGPLPIIAGPGSGKTFTFVERTVYLITERSARTAICAITVMRRIGGGGRGR